MWLKRRNEPERVSILFPLERMLAIERIEHHFDLALHVGFERKTVVIDPDLGVERANSIAVDPEQQLVATWLEYRRHTAPLLELRRAVVIVITDFPSVWPANSSIYC